MGQVPEFVRAPVLALLGRYREGTVVLLKHKKAEGERFWIPSWRLAEGDVVEGEFLRGKKFWYPPRPEGVRVYPKGAKADERELGQVVYTVLPQFGYKRALDLGKNPEAFLYLLGEKPLKDLFSPAERFELREVEKSLASWRWFFESLKALVEAGFTPLEAQAALDTLGEPATELARANPFLLAQVPGVSYASLVARFGRQDLVGELLEWLKEQAIQYGDTAAVLSPSQAERIEPILEASMGQVRKKGRVVALERFASWEEEIYENLSEGSQLPPLPPPPDLGEDQAKVVELLQHRVAVLTGGPGTGKTYTLSRVVSTLTEKGVPVTLVAPTGKAAQRMAQMAQMEARTIHGFLRLKPHEVFKSAGAHFPAGLVVLDEASMLDLETTVHVLRALPEGASLLLVGDVDQLPPVQAGQPFADLVRLAPSVRLRQVRRQADPQAGLLQAARATLSGTPWEEVVRRKPRDLLYKRVEDGKEAHRLVEAVVRHYLDRGLPKEEVQVLTPVHDGPFGTKALNALLRRVFQREVGLRKSYLELSDGQRAYVGEKIIFNENRYDYGVANGMTGVVEAVDETGFTLRVGRDRLVLPRFLAGKASLAYAITVHRSQGSEWRVVVLVLPKTVLTTRRLVYTALTRAKEQAVVLTTLDLLHEVIPPDRPRVTWLNAATASVE